MKNRSNLKQCPLCDKWHPQNDFHDITIIEDWWTVCDDCFEKHGKKHQLLKYEDS